MAKPTNQIRVIRWNRGNREFENARINVGGEQVVFEINKNGYLEAKVSPETAKFFAERKAYIVDDAIEKDGFDFPQQEDLAFIEHALSQTQRPTLRNRRKRDYQCMIFARDLLRTFL